MIFQTHQPRRPLGKFIERFIYYDGLRREHLVERFLPDGNVEIIIDLDDTPQYIYDNETLKEIQACHLAWASGVRTRPITIPSGKGSAMFIIVFKYGMAYPFFPFPMNELSDYVVDANLIWGDEFLFLREAVLRDRNSARKFEIVEEYLINKFKEKLVSNPCVEFAVDELVRRPNQLVLKSLSEKIGYSQKHFISMFKRQVGVTPKNYLKTMRFQKAVKEIEVAADLDWSLVSSDCGFYDQAHFINDFKKFSGFTPGSYLKKKNGVMNYVPVG